MDVFTIEWCDKCLIQRRDNRVGHVIAAMLDLLQSIEPVSHVGWAFQNVLEEAGTLGNVLRHFREHAEEFGLSRNQTDHETWGSSMASRARRIARWQEKRITISRGLYSVKPRWPFLLKEFGSFRALELCPGPSTRFSQGVLTEVIPQVKKNGLTSNRLTPVVAVRSCVDH